MSGAEHPRRLGKYEILRPIARGSMGLVYLGHDSFLERQVAVKVAHREILRDPDRGRVYQRMFFNEAQTAGRLSHPNILAVYDAGIEDETLYIVMEYVEGGRTLKPHTRPDNLLPVEQVVELVFRCARALDYAHRHGVIHRDVKPGNLLLTPEMDVKVGDFSIAYISQPDLAVTQPLGLVGSPKYMSPEQVREETPTGQSDLFALGIVLYELLTGRHPFQAESLSGLLHRIVQDDPPPLRALRPELPEVLEPVVARALAKDPAERFATGLDMAAELSRAFDFLEHPRREVDEEERFRALRALAFFADFPEAEVWEVLRAGLWARYGPGEAILREGELDDAFYVVVEGEVEVRKAGRSIGLLRAGDCFGEMGYVTKGRRQASILARTPVAVLKVTASHIERVSLSCQLHFHKVFLRTLIERLSAANARLVREGA
ncbi:serine/threonine-protein kinase [Inmirania thermothiophila]|uniref:Serine/threonine protein kinase n=1 Tax=Inmirania thermothiophila TaxID=1750597 RepID=A0A3N1XQW5_9GAMM|nr:serine/threonine-protein kinase [Inmirania thermothiophila]ROR29064.1 serine/threonine protein kinase [Inmirania thermothiophila]